MTSQPGAPAAVSPSEDDQAMAKYGIKLLNSRYYRYREFRYTNLKDAIAQAIRDL